MKTSNGKGKQAARNILLTIVCVAVVLAMMVALPQSAMADNPTPPPMPGNLQVDPGNNLYMVGHAEGTQDYICLAQGTAFAWSFLRPQATLFNDQEEQVITHFLSPDPNGTPRATWQHSLDTSAIWAGAIASSSDPAYVAPGAIPWLKLQVFATQDGPRNGDKLSEITFIQRLNTTGGVAPSTGCSSATNIGAKAYVPYAADYYFYRLSGN